jgi:hypothetical protein
MAYLNAVQSVLLPIKSQSAERSKPAEDAQHRAVVVSRGRCVASQYQREVWRTFATQMKKIAQAERTLLAELSLTFRRNVRSVRI